MSALIDLTGQKFGEWTVLEKGKSDKHYNTKWVCQCSCGTIKEVASTSLRKGLSLSCGCKKIEKSRTNNGTYKDELGNVYGKLTVIGKDEQLSIEKHRAYWICQCECGNIKTVSSKLLRNGHTRSCGCLLSRGEEKIHKYLQNNNINYIPQYQILINGTYYRCDFALIDNNKNIKAIIEFNGIQHYDDTRIHWKTPYEIVHQRDLNKKDYCENILKVPLFEIPYWELENIEQVLQKIIFSLNMEEAQEAEN